MNHAEEKVAFFHAVGEAMAQWAYVEYQLWQLAALAFPVPQRRSVIVAFNSIENFRSRLAVCDKYLEQAFGAEDHFEIWKAIKLKLQKLSTKRNKIAHRVPVLYVNAQQGRRFALEDWSPDVMNGGDRPSTEAMCVQQIAHARREFHQLTIDLASYNSVLTRGQKLPPAFNIDVERQPLLREIKAQLNWSLGLPPPRPRKKAAEK
jgi:hypothetical protein